MSLENGLRVGIALAIYKPDIELLRRQLMTIREQTYQNWFLLIHDDCSLSADQLKSLDDLIVSILADVRFERRFALMQGAERRGAVGNFSSALAAMPGDCALIAFCDQDDEWVPEKLAAMVAEFADTRVMAVHSDLSLIDREGKLLSESCWTIERRDRDVTSFARLMVRNSVTGCALMFRSSLLSLILPIPAVTIAKPEFFHDVWVAMMALSQGRVLSLPRPLVRYRQHGGNVVGAERPNRLPPLSRLLEKATHALATRCSLEEALHERLWGGRETNGRQPRKRPQRIFSGRLDLGIPIFVRILTWTMTSSRGYLRIGLQLTLGKLISDVRRTCGRVT